MSENPVVYQEAVYACYKRQNAVTCIWTGQKASLLRWSGGVTGKTHRYGDQLGIVGATTYDGCYEEIALGTGDWPMLCQQWLPSVDNSYYVLAVKAAPGGVLETGSPLFDWVLAQTFETELRDAEADMELQNKIAQAERQGRIVAAAAKVEAPGDPEILAAAKARGAFAMAKCPVYHHGKLAKWHKRAGDYVAPLEPVFCIEAIRQEGLAGMMDVDARFNFAFVLVETLKRERDWVRGDEFVFNYVAAEKWKAFEDELLGLRRQAEAQRKWQAEQAEQERRKQEEQQRLQTEIQRRKEEEAKRREEERRAEEVRQKVENERRREEAKAQAAIAEQKSQEARRDAAEREREAEQVRLKRMELENESRAHEASLAQARAVEQEAFARVRVAEEQAKVELARLQVLAEERRIEETRTEQKRLQNQAREQEVILRQAGAREDERKAEESRAQALAAQRGVEEAKTAQLRLENEARTQYVALEQARGVQAQAATEQVRLQILTEERRLKEAEGENLRLQNEARRQEAVIAQARAAEQDTLSKERTAIAQAEAAKQEALLKERTAVEQARAEAARVHALEEERRIEEIQQRRGKDERFRVEEARRQQAEHVAEERQIREIELLVARQRQEGEQKKLEIQLRMEELEHQKRLDQVPLEVLVDTMFRYLDRLAPAWLRAQAELKLVELFNRLDSILNESSRVPLWQRLAKGEEFREIQEFESYVDVILEKIQRVRTDPRMEGHDDLRQEKAEALQGVLAQYRRRFQSRQRAEEEIE